MTRGLTLSDVGITIDGSTLLHVDFTVSPGQVMTLMGPSGSGKSTLLTAISGQLPAAFKLSGRITLDGHALLSKPANARRIGLMYQDHLLFPHLSVGANMAFGLRPGGTRKERRATVNAALNQVGLAGFHDRDPATLSGGQRARVALMRMLLAEPDCILLDEPFSRLDHDLRTTIRDMVFSLAKQLDVPILLVTHDAEDATAAAGAVLSL